MEYLVARPEELDPVAEALLSWAGERRKFFLYGEIGAGKTTFIQAVCRRLGVREKVTSPTFGLVNEYTYPDQQGCEQRAYHLDLYRLTKLEEALDIGIEDYLDDAAYCFVEWPDLIEALAPPEVVRIKLSITGNSSRKILFL